MIYRAPLYSAIRTKQRPITVRRAANRISHHGLLIRSGQMWRCAIGKSGITVAKREGDGATPAGTLMVVAGYYRPDRIKVRPAPWLKPITPHLGWCDQPRDPAYNRPVILPYRGRHEKMYRDDGLYDLCIILDWNFHPRRRHAGSAIFLHCATAELEATQGCLALPVEKLVRLLRPMRPGQIIRVCA